MTLTNEEKYPEAQRLLEAAVLVPQKMGDYFRFTLAECLLSQHKEATRALELVEQAMANLERKSQSKQDRIFLAQCSAIAAWALASCGRREEAEARLEDAFTESNSVGKDDLAGLLQLKGETWLALGDSQMAQASFQQALDLFPYGSIGMLARRKLAKLGKTVRG